MDEPQNDAGKTKTAIQRKHFDLSVPAKHSDNPPITRRGKPGGITSPAEQMRDMGFCPTADMTPLEFLLAVMNEDVDRLYKQEKKRNMMRAKGIGLNYRVDCAKTAAKFMHMAMPSVHITDASEHKFGDDLAAAISEGNTRVEKRTIILETVERISPDTPLAPASYPEAFKTIKGEIIEEDLNAEGNTDYDPDRDD